MVAGQLPPFAPATAGALAQAGRLPPSGHLASSIGMRGSGLLYGSADGPSLGRWPQGTHWASHDDLPASLTDSAEGHARNALRCWASQRIEDQLSAAVSAGCAVELMAKARLAGISPSLMAERADLDTMLHLAGQGEKASEPPTIATCFMPSSFPVTITPPTFPYYAYCPASLCSPELA
jgi:hypothetical protein